MSAYYNEVDPFCAQWLRNLIDAGHIPPGDVDERPIEEVSPDDVRPYTQCHFFAGIGGWAYAARLAGIADDAELWTGSCPCQPYSAAGRGLADDDVRNLWPHMRRLIAECQPTAVAGEQVASKAGRLWLAGVRADLEALGYGFGAADLCAAGVAAPHVRQRLWWVGDARGERTGRNGRAVSQSEASGERQRVESGRIGNGTGDAGVSCRLEHADAARRSQGGLHPRPGQPPTASVLKPWASAQWIECADGKARRIEPGIEPLADGVLARVGRLRAYGNAIVPQVAAEFLMAWVDVS